MKGVNLKKIGAIVAGATILASSVAFAGLMFGNTALVDDNGQPVAKVVLGSGAAPSDGAVAGAIAAKLASAAYAKKTLTAVASADATCTTGASGNSSGTCAVSNKKVTLEVTVPGSTNSGIAEFTTLIGDYIDRTLRNRFTSTTDTAEAYVISEAETSVDANPFDRENGAFVVSPGDTTMYKIDGTAFGPFASATVTDPSSGDTYTEMQNAWVEGTTQFSSSDKAIEFSPSLITYQVKFDNGGHYGISECTTDDASTGNKDFGACTVSASEYTGKHRVKVSFLGSDWIITEMVRPATSLTTTSPDEVNVGGSIKLAKESVYGIINVGDSITSKDGQLKIRLDDISTLENIKPAVVSIIDANGNVLSQDQIAPGATLKKTVAGKTYRIRVYQTAPGYTFGAKWAELALLENELELKDGDSLDNGVNTDWNVHLLWKNRDAAATPAAATYYDSLRGILLYKQTFGSALMAGDSINVVEDPTAYKLTYTGLDLASSDYDTLKYSTGGSVSFTIDGTTTGTCTIPANDYIKISSNVDDAFTSAAGATTIATAGGAVGSAGTGRGKDVYYVKTTPGAGCSGVTNGDYVVKKSGSSNYVAIEGTGANDVLQYKTAGSLGTAADGGIITILNDGATAGISPAAGETGSNTNPLITLSEDIGSIKTATGTDDHSVELEQVYFDATNGFEAFDGTTHTADKLHADVRTSMTDADLSTLGYTVEGTAKLFDKAEFISPRGSKFDSMSSSAVTFKVAKKLGHAVYDFATTEAASTGAATTVLTLSEGQTGTVGSVTIKAKSIDVTVGACTASGGAATCTVPKDTINAVIMPNNAASADVAVPFAVNPKLVVLDRDAAAVSTGVLITVGGDKVNSVTADAMAGAGIDFTATPQVVKAVGNKIIVAGLTAQDTIAAGDQFLAQVQSQ